MSGSVAAGGLEFEGKPTASRPNQAGSHDNDNLSIYLKDLNERLPGTHKPVHGRS
jgi:hypothetical protein